MTRMGALIAPPEEGRRYSKVAELPSVNVPAVKARVHRVRGRLREHNEARF